MAKSEIKSLVSADRARKRAAELMQASEEKQKAYTDRIEAESANLKEAEEKMNTSMASDDFDGYHAAKEERQRAADALEMAEECLKRTQEEPIISEEEYKSLVDGILEEGEQLKKQTAKELDRLTREMQDAGKSYEKLCHDANQALYQLQHGVNRDQDMPRDPAGNVTGYGTGKQKAIRDYGLYDWSQTATNHGACQKYRGNGTANSSWVGVIL